MRTYEELCNQTIPDPRDTTILSERLGIIIPSRCGLNRPLIAMIVDIDNFRPFYRKYGPEQRLIVIGNLFDYFNSNKESDDPDLFFVDRVEVDQFVLVTKNNADLAERIRREIADMRFPLFNKDLVSQVISEGVAIHPDRVTVHIGQSGFISQPDLDYDSLLSSLYTLTMEARETGVKRKDWVNYVEAP